MIRYFVSKQFDPPTLLRRSDDGDQAFVNGNWRSTKAIVDYEFGHNDFVDTVGEEVARQVAPAAFAA